MQQEVHSQTEADVQLRHHDEDGPLGFQPEPSHTAVQTKLQVTDTLLLYWFVTGSGTLLNDPLSTESTNLGQIASSLWKHFPEHPETGGGGP